MYTDMCTETPTQSSVNATGPAVIVGVVSGSLILILAFVIVGLGIIILLLCVQFRKKSKQTTGASIISLLCNSTE